MPYQMNHHDEGQDNRVRKVDRRTCIFFVGSTSALSARTQFVCQSAVCTLYPAAYPRPGNNDVNFLVTVALEYSLNITVFKWEADVI